MAACSQSAVSYRAPDPGTPGLARITALYSEPMSREVTRPPSLTLHLYDLGDRCVNDEVLDTTYLGSVSLERFEREIRVPSGRYLLFRVVLHAWAGPAAVSCRLAAGFEPEPGGEYRLDFSVFTTRSCRLHLRDAEGHDVPLFAPPHC